MIIKVRKRLLVADNCLRFAPQSLFSSHSFYSCNKTQSYKNGPSTDCALECQSSMGQLDQFKQLVDGMHKLMSDLVDAVPKDEFTTLTNDLASLKSTIAEIQVVKECDFIEEEAQNITGISQNSKKILKSLSEQLCGQYIVGWWAVLASSLVISILIAQLLFFAPCVWRSFEVSEDTM